VADERQVTAEEIVQWVNGQVANHKKLRGGVIFVPAIPRSPAGKILRKVLRDAAKNESEQARL
jgi:4-coumarate--CoA ligase